MTVNGRDYQKSVVADLTPWLEYLTDGFLVSLHVLDAEIRVLGLLMPPKSGCVCYTNGLIDYLTRQRAERPK